tara:strand:+ start:698 stop:1399 length:702 start_codon:yes stop_codon:yes gene_type:complete
MTLVKVGRFREKSSSGCIDTIYAFSEMQGTGGAVLNSGKTLRVEKLTKINNRILLVSSGTRTYRHKFHQFLKESSKDMDVFCKERPDKSYFEDIHVSKLDRFIYLTIVINGSIDITKYTENGVSDVSEEPQITLGFEPNSGYDFSKSSLQRPRTRSQIMRLGYKRVKKAIINCGGCGYGIEGYRLSNRKITELRFSKMMKKDKFNVRDHTVQRDFWGKAKYLSGERCPQFDFR